MFKKIWHKILQFAFAQIYNNGAIDKSGFCFPTQKSCWFLAPSQPAKVKISKGVVMYKIFAKTILTAYSSLEFVVGQIDVLVRKKVASGYTSGDACVSAQRQIEEIVVLMDKKANLINLKLLADETLSKMDRAGSSVLTDRYIKKIKWQQSMEQMGLSKRTFFRRLERAHESFAKSCFARGYNQTWLEENYFDQSWIKDIFFHYKDKQNK